MLTGTVAGEVLCNDDADAARRRRLRRGDAPADREEQQKLGEVHFLPAAKYANACMRTRNGYLKSAFSDVGRDFADCVAGGPRAGGTGGSGDRAIHWHGK